MIADKDRAYYIGASDTSHVVGNWNTKSFEKWFLEKQGYINSNLNNVSMMAGTAYEHAIIDSLSIHGIQKDTQIIKERLRVNLDANTDTAIYEIKTYKLEKGFKVPLGYRRQVWVQMYATGIRTAYIVAYGLTDVEYQNFYRDIERDRLGFYEILYNSEFIEGEYLPKLKYISHCLDFGLFPQPERFKNYCESR